MTGTEPSAHHRPQQVTVSAGLALAGSVLLVLVVYQAVADLATVDMRASIAERLATSDPKISTDTAISALRVGYFLLGGCAAAAAVLAGFCLQRHRGARVGLAAVAVPIVLGMPLAGLLWGSFLGSIVAAGAAMLWTVPAREWFTGQPVPAGPGRPGSPSGAPARPDPGPPRTASVTPPAATPVPPAAGVPQPPWPPVRPPVAPPRPDARPGDAAEPPAQVRTACLLATWFSVLTGLAMVAVAVVIVVDGSLATRSLSQADLTRLDVTRAQARWMAFAGALLFVAWAAGAVVVARFTRRRQEWAWWLLVISAGCAALIMLVMVVALPLALAPFIGAAACFALLLTEPSRTWITRRPPR